MLTVKKTGKMVAAGAFGVAMLLTTGCGTSLPRVSSMNTNTEPGYAEPNPLEALVYADAGLGASDSLGHQVFVADSDTRFVMGRVIWQMAAADDPSIKLDEVFGDSAVIEMPQAQAIVSADEMRARQRQRDGIEPTFQPVGPGTEVASPDVETQFERFDRNRDQR